MGCVILHVLTSLVETKDSTYSYTRHKWMSRGVTFDGGTFTRYIMLPYTNGGKYCFKKTEFESLEEGITSTPVK